VAGAVVILAIVQGWFTGFVMVEKLAAFSCSSRPRPACWRGQTFIRSPVLQAVVLNFKLAEKIVQKISGALNVNL
jgi:hypothetical protein